MFPTSTSTSQAASSTGTPAPTQTSSPESSTPSNTETTSIPTSSATTAPNLSTQATSPAAFPLAAKIGLGVGIPVALILGLAAGWFLFRRQRHEKNDVMPEYAVHEVHVPMTQYKSYDNASHHGSDMNVTEAPAHSPVELAQGYYAWKSQAQSKSETPAIVRYEIYNSTPIRDSTLLRFSTVVVNSIIRSLPGFDC
ncbi:hypothetical protein A1F95_08823, partial [Pyrenophora tritici-repentis]